MSQYLVCHDDYVFQHDFEKYSFLILHHNIFLFYILKNSLKIFPIFSVVSNIWSPLYIECICGHSHERVLDTYIALLGTFKNNLKKITERPSVFA